MITGLKKAAQKAYEKIHEAITHEKEYEAALKEFKFAFKNYEESIAFAQKSIEAQVDLGAAYKLAGEVFISLQRYQEAERAFLYGLFFGETDASTATNLAILSAMKGHNDLAKSFFNEALKLQPAHELAVTNLKNLETQEATLNLDI